MHQFLQYPCSINLQELYLDCVCIKEKQVSENLLHLELILSKCISTEEYRTLKYVALKFVK